MAVPLLAHLLLHAIGLTIAGLVVLAVLVALFLPEKIFSRVLFAWSALGAAFGPVLFCRLAGFSVHPAGVLAPSRTLMLSAAIIASPTSGGGGPVRLRVYSI